MEVVAVRDLQVSIGEPLNVLLVVVVVELGLLRDPLHWPSEKCSFAVQSDEIQLEVVLHLHLAYSIQIHDAHVLATLHPCGQIVSMMECVLVWCLPWPVFLGNAVGVVMPLVPLSAMRCPTW